jgi:hypothetical protein
VSATPMASKNTMNTHTHLMYLRDGKYDLPVVKDLDTTCDAVGLDLGFRKDRFDGVDSRRALLWSVLMCVDST